MTLDTLMMIELEPSTLKIIHDTAVVAAIFLIGMLAGFMYHIYMCNRERMKAQKEEKSL